MESVSIVILAAGQSRRMGENKLLLRYKDKSFLEHAVDLALSISDSEVILVISTQNFRAVKSQLIATKLKIVINDEDSRVQSTSVYAGVKKANGKGGYLFLPIDQPLLTKVVIEQIIANRTPNNIVIPLTAAGEPSFPVYFSPCFRDELLHIRGDNGGRQIFKNHPEACIFLSIRSTSSLKDIDTRSEYNELCNRLAEKELDNYE